MFRTAQQSAFVPAFRAAAAGRQRAAVTGRRGYANAAGGAGGGNLPLILGGLGLVGLGSYVYMERNPSAKAAASANANELKDRAKDAASNAQDKVSEIGDRAKGAATSGAAAASANANEAASNAKDAVKGAVDDAKAKVDEATDGVQALIKDKWVDFTLAGKEDYNHNTAIYTFKFDSPDAIAGGKVASALLVKSSDPAACRDEKDKPVIRPYTPISSQDEKGQLRLMVKVYPEGKMSQHIAHLNVGDKLAFKGPIAKHQYQPNEFKQGVCVSGGSGITPMYQMISHSLNISDDKTQWTLLFANVTEKDILLRKEWDNLAKAHPDRFKIVYTLDKPPMFWRGEKGFISKEMIEKYVPKEESIKFFVCGPPGQVNAMCGPKDGPRQGPVTGVLGELGYNNDTVFKF